MVVFETEKLGSVEFCQCKWIRSGEMGRVEIEKDEA